MQFAYYQYFVNKSNEGNCSYMNGVYGFRRTVAAFIKNFFEYQKGDSNTF